MSIFVPLILPGQLTALPQNYGHRLTLFDGTSEIIAYHHVAKVTDFIDLEEVDNEDAKMCIIAQSFSGEVKKWFRSLGDGTIGTSQ